MTFEEILDQAIAMLQRRGRLTYRTLQRQFQLDDATLNDLKHEIIYGQRLALDEEGRVLVWTGDAVSSNPPGVSPLPVSGPPPRGYTPAYLAEKILSSRTALEAGIVRNTPDQRRAPVFRIGQDPGISCRANAARALWLLGYAEQALAQLHEALELAYALSHPYSLAFARCWAAMVSQLRRDVPAVYEYAEATTALSTEQGFLLYAALGTSLHGWALALQGQGEAGMAQVRQGITAFQATGAALNVPYLCAVLADIADHLDCPREGLQALTEAHTLVEQQEERWWEAEIHRLRGVLLLRQAETLQEEAETWLQRALDVARRQEAKSLELRAAMSLSRLWQQQGKRQEAHDLLAGVYGWFTEGFDTADLQEARALLNELG